MKIVYTLDLRNQEDVPYAQVAAELFEHLAAGLRAEVAGGPVFSKVGAGVFDDGNEVVCTSID